MERLKDRLFLIANIAPSSKALVTRSDALVSTSFLLLLVRHLLLEAMHLFLLASLGKALVSIDRYYTM